MTVGQIDETAAPSRDVRSEKRVASAYGVSVGFSAPVHRKPPQPPPRAGGLSGQALSRELVTVPPAPVLRTRATSGPPKSLFVSQHDRSVLNCYLSSHEEGSRRPSGRSSRAHLASAPSTSASSTSGSFKSRSCERETLRGEREAIAQAAPSDLVNAMQQQQLFQQSLRVSSPETKSGCEEDDVLERALAFTAVHGYEEDSMLESSGSNCSALLTQVQPPAQKSAHPLPPTICLGLPPRPTQRGHNSARSNAQSTSSKRCLSARTPRLPPITESQELIERKSKGSKGDPHRRAVSLPPLSSEASCNTGVETPFEVGQLKDEVQELLKSFDDDMKADKIRRKKMKERAAAAAKAIQTSASDGISQQLSDGVRDLYQNVSRIDNHRKEQEGLRQLVANRKIRDVKRRLEKQQSGVPSSTGEAVETAQKHLSEMHQQRRQVSELKDLMANLSSIESEDCSSEVP